MSQVEEVAIKKHRSLEAIEELRHRRVEAKISERVEKRKLDSHEEAGSKRLQQQQARIRERLAQEYTAPERRFSWIAWICSMLHHSTFSWNNPGVCV